MSSPPKKRRRRTLRQVARGARRRARRAAGRRAPGLAALPAAAGGHHHAGHLQSRWSPCSASSSCSRSSDHAGGQGTGGEERGAVRQERGARIPEPARRRRRPISPPTPARRSSRAAEPRSARRSTRSRSEPDRRYSVIIRNEDRPGESIGTTTSTRRSIPPKLRDEMLQDGRRRGQHLVHQALLQGAGTGAGHDHRHSPRHQRDRLDGAYEIYYLVPLDKEEQTLSSVQQTLIAVGAGLVLLLGRDRLAGHPAGGHPGPAGRQAAERLAAGRLDERMKVRGEDDLARLATSFNEMAANLQLQIHQLEELSQLQRRFISDVSHELRTPLTTVRMAADLLYDAREDFDPMAVARRAELLQAQLDRFEALLTDLLEISRFDAGAADAGRRLRGRQRRGAPRGRRLRGAGRASLAPASSCALPGEPVHGRGGHPPGRAHPAQPARQRDRARRGPARSSSRSARTGTRWR